MFITKLKLADFGGLKPSELHDLFEFMDFYKSKNYGKTYEILGVLRKKSECGVRVNVDGHQQFFIEEDAFIFDVIENSEKLRLQVLEVTDYGSDTDQNHLSKAKISGNIYAIESFQKRINNVQIILTFKTT